MEDTELTNIWESNSPRAPLIKYTALFEIYVSSSIEEFLFENWIVNENDSFLWKMIPSDILKAVE